MVRCIAALTMALLVALLAEHVEAHSYKLTYYHPSFEGGPLGCGSDIYGSYKGSDPTTAAISRSSSFECGDRLQVCGSSCAVVIVKDYCGGCSYNHIDLSLAAWDAVGGVTSGEVTRVTIAMELPDVGRTE